MDKTVLITGGSRGIGAATAISAAKKGYQVCVNYLKNKEAALEVADAIHRSGGKALTIQADISVEIEIVKMFEAVDDFGKLTALVNKEYLITTY